MMRSISIALCFVLILLSCRSTTERRIGYEVHGIDISHYQSVIQWDTIAEQNIHFAFAKASEGNTWRDNHFCHNWQEMKRLGLKRGAYHFFRPQVSPSLQIENFVEMVDLEIGDLPPVLDVELLDGVDKATLVAGVKEWLLLAEYRYKVRPILYSNYNFYLRYLADDFSAYPLWIARYSHQTPYLGGNNYWQFWQYGNKGRVEGIEGDVDLNVFRGTLQELEALCLPPATIISALY